MKEFAKRFERVYDVLYNAHWALLNYDNAAERHDQLMKTSEEYATKAAEFVKMRHGDPLTSDRECAAFCICYYWGD